MARTKAGAVSTAAIEHERLNFVELLAINPNHFGTLGAGKAAVLEMSANAKYEQLTCVSYSPELTQLEATIAVNLPYGYSGGLCDAGSREYVRFYLDYGAGWVDSGVVGVEVHDVTAGDDCEGSAFFPFIYVASLPVQPDQRWCNTPVLPRVRAILSWQLMPPAGQPNWSPVWGDVRECSIQIPPRQLWLEELPALLADSAAASLPADLQAAAKTPVSLPDPPALKLSELAELYLAKKPSKAKEAVAPHRFASGFIHQAVHATTVSLQELAGLPATWKEAGLDWQKAVGAWLELNGDTSYEELECLGLDNNLDRLTATLRIKRRAGYSGELCQPGSIEYVSFWADWDNGCSWTYLGTAQVRVHDLPEAPDDGLCYSAVLPVDLTYVRKPCDQPVLSRVRAVLSWNSPPSTTDPNALAQWGNLIDAHVQVAPGPVVDPANPTAIIGFLGSIPVSKIDSATGLTAPDATFYFNGIAPDPSGRPCPFGGRIVVQGPPAVGYKYRVQVKRTTDVAWSTVTTTLTLVDQTGTIFTSQSPDANGFFVYQPTTVNNGNILAWWDSGGDDLWDVKLELADLADNPIATPDIHRLQLDNTAPEADIDITLPGGNCGKFAAGTVLSGTFVARDSYLGSYSLGTSPFAGPVIPAGGNAPTAPPPGDSWSLDTTGMQACGYIIQVTVVDRAIVNSASVGHWASAARGFCLD